MVVYTLFTHSNSTQEQREYAQFLAVQILPGFYALQTLLIRLGSGKRLGSAGCRAALFASTTAQGVKTQLNEIVSSRARPKICLMASWAVCLAYTLVWQQSSKAAACPYVVTFYSPQPRKVEAQPLLGDVEALFSLLLRKKTPRALARV